MIQRYWKHVFQGFPNGITDASAGSCQYRQARAGQASEKAKEWRAEKEGNSTSSPMAQQMGSRQNVIVEVRWQARKPKVRPEPSQSPHAIRLVTHRHVTIPMLRTVSTKLSVVVGVDVVGGVLRAEVTGEGVNGGVRDAVAAVVIVGRVAESSDRLNRLDRHVPL